MVRTSVIEVVRVALVALLGAVLGWSCAGREEAPPRLDDEPADAGTEQSCEPADPAAGALLPLGWLEGAEYWDCPWPSVGTEPARFTSSVGDLDAVTGGPVTIPLGWEGADRLDGRRIYFTYPGMRGFFVVPAPSGDAPLLLSVLIAPEAPGGELVLQLAIDDGQSTPDAPNVGPTFSIALHVIAVRSGALQVNLYWDTLADLDLHVFEPSGEEIYHNHTPSLSGGQPDLDSYAACSAADGGRGIENVFWPDDYAPSGEYRVVAHLYNDCGTYAQGIDTNYRVTVIRNRNDLVSYQGVMTSSTDREVEVARFYYP